MNKLHKFIILIIEIIIKYTDHNKADTFIRVKRLELLQLKTKL